MIIKNEIFDDFQNVGKKRMFYTVQLPTVQEQKMLILFSVGGITHKKDLPFQKEYTLSCIFHAIEHVVNVLL